MANGDAWHNDVPSWAKTFAFLVGTVGAPMVITAFFLAQNAGFIGSVGQRNTARLDAMTLNQQAIIAEIKEDRREGKELIDKLTRALRVICKNTSKSQQESSNCEMIQ
jgi:hypothetical protein